MRYLARKDRRAALRRGLSAAMRLVIIEAMQLTLSPVEARVLGALIEKEITTPEYYPLSLNALVNACNQKSNRDPLLHLEENEIRRALNHLESQSLVRSVGDSRVTKFEHRLQETFNFYRPEIAVICELLLRGPQTPGELRNRASRMHPFEDLESVHSALQRLAKREPPMVVILPRQPGTKEARYAHLLSEHSPLETAAVEAVLTEVSGHAGAVAAASSLPDEAVAALKDEVAQLRAQIADLQSQFAAFRKQFE
jgi:uncharacterized protein YceH (UPF0502 family)